MGLSVIRPSMRAVGSPRRLAIQACADSWTLIANRNAINWNTCPGCQCVAGSCEIGFDTNTRSR